MNKQGQKVLKKSASKAKNPAMMCDCSKQTKELNRAQGRISKMITGEDLRMAVLIVSVIINLFFLIAWVTLQITDAYDGEVASALFDRTLIR